MLRALLGSLAALVFVLAFARGASAMRLDPALGVPVRDLDHLNKGVCVTYTVDGATSQVAVPYPSWVTYHQIGNSGYYWLYINRQPGIRVGSLVFSRLYEPAGGGLPTSCNPPS